MIPPWILALVVFIFSAGFVFISSGQLIFQFNFWKKVLISFVILIFTHFVLSYLHLIEYNYFSQERLFDIPIELYLIGFSFILFIFSFFNFIEGQPEFSLRQLIDSKKLNQMIYFIFAFILGFLMNHEDLKEIATIKLLFFIIYFSFPYVLLINLHLTKNLYPWIYIFQGIALVFSLHFNSMTDSLILTWASIFFFYIKYFPSGVFSSIIMKKLYYIACIAFPFLMGYYYLSYSSPDLIIFPVWKTIIYIFVICAVPWHLFDKESLSPFSQMLSNILWFLSVIALLVVTLISLSSREELFAVMLLLFVNMHLAVIYLNHLKATGRLSADATFQLKNKSS